MSNQIVVYVQAMPLAIASSSRRFEDLQDSEFEMTHSSKTALSFALSLGSGEIIAVGYPPILRDAIIRGATRFKTVPLCDDPFHQLSFFPEVDNADHIVIGENPEWIFTGASLAGVAAQRMVKRLIICNTRDSLDLSIGSVILVRDSGTNTGGIDIRRVKSASDASVNSEEILGNSTVLRQESGRTEVLNGQPTEVGSLLARKLRRLARA